MLGPMVSHYRLLNPLGSGGMGVVYRAEDTTLGRTVALKFLPERSGVDPRSQARLREEARTASALNHPNICTIFEVGESSGEFYIAMEYVEGRPLAESIRPGGVPVETALRYARQLASALEHAHARGVIHRDLKPRNIVVTPQGDAKILDFGLARRTDPAEFDRKTLELTSTADAIGVAGTFPYMAPEQLEGKDATPRSDIWALGVVLHEMVTGERPFRGENLFRLCTAIVRDPPPPLPAHVPPGLAAVIHRCLEKEPERRYQRAGEVRAALEAIAPEISLPASRAQRPRFSRSLLAAAGFAALLVFALLFPRPAGFRLAEVPAMPAHMQLAILPPESSAGGSQAAFDNGLVDTLTSRLGALTDRHPLAVIPASEMRAKKVTSIEGARSEFGVNLVLVLHIQHVAEQVRVNYSLVDTHSRQQLRGDTITASASNPFALQDRVAENVVETLALQIRPREMEALQAHGTAQPAAYDFYLQGRGYLRDIGKLESLESAVAVFQRALEKDPAFAAADAGLGEAYWRKVELTHDSRWVGEATAACQRAAARDPALAVAHTCLGLVFNGTGKYEQAAAEYQTAARLAPTLDDAHSGLALAFERLDRPADAEKAFREAMALQPAYWAGYNRLGNFFLRQGRLEEAAQMYAQVVSLVPDSFIGYSNAGIIRVLQGRKVEAIPLLERSLAIRRTGPATSNLATAYFQSARYADSARLFEEAARLDPESFELWGNLGDAYYWAPGLRERAPAAYRKAVALAEKRRKVNPRDADTLGYLAGYYAMLGEPRQARGLIAEALRLAPRTGEVLYSAALVYAQLGELPRAVTALEHAVAAGYPAATIRDTPNFQALKDNPRFTALVSAPETQEGKKP
jgi:tetratricopeptide (TPR) repeat protein/predicted Ser/Thr protein kinase